MWIRSFNCSICCKCFLSIPSLVIFICDIFYHKSILNLSAFYVLFCGFVSKENQVIMFSSVWIILISWVEHAFYQHFLPFLSHSKILYHFISCLLPYIFWLYCSYEQLLLVVLLGWKWPDVYKFPLLFCWSPWLKANILDSHTL